MLRVALVSTYCIWCMHKREFRFRVIVWPHKLYGLFNYGDLIFCGGKREGFILWYRNFKTESLQVLMSRGRLFQAFGAVTENNISPYIFSLYAGMVSRCWSDDRIWREDIHVSKRYWVAMPCRHRYIKMGILNWILLFNGNQCRCDSTGEIWSYFLILETTRAILLWICCSLFIWEFCRPMSNELQ